MVAGAFFPYGYATIVNDDYVAASGTVRFAPGETRQTVALTIKGDTLLEPGERVIVAFSNPINAPGGIGGYFSLGFATIVNDD